MGDYSDGKPVVRPGRVNVTEHHEHKSATVDVNELAKAVAAELAKTMFSQAQQAPTQPTIVRSNTGQDFEDDFDNKDTLAKLADNMTVHQGEGRSNFAHLGGIKETKKDQKEVDKTIDILRNLD